MSKSNKSRLQLPTKRKLSAKQQENLAKQKRTFMIISNTTTAIDLYERERNMRYCDFKHMLIQKRSTKTPK